MFGPQISLLVPKAPWINIPYKFTYQLRYTTHYYFSIRRVSHEYSIFARSSGYTRSIGRYTTSKSCKYFSSLNLKNSSQGFRSTRESVVTRPVNLVGIFVRFTPKIPHKVFVYRTPVNNENDKIYNESSNYSDRWLIPSRGEVSTKSHPRLEKVFIFSFVYEYSEVHTNIRE